MLRTSPRRSHADGALYLWPDAFLYVGRDVVPDLHRHNAVECAIALDGPLRVQTECGIDTEVRDALLVDANVRHSISSPGHNVAFLYLEKTCLPSSTLPENAIDRIASGIFALGPTLSANLRAHLSKTSSGELSEVEASATKTTILSLFMPCRSASPPIDPRVRTVLAHIASHADAPLSGDALAALAGLSSDRFQHLFKQNIGMPVRRYLLWFRIRRVIEAVSDGANLTRAAHEAGFSDSAHFSRTFRAMIGIAPSALFIQAPRVSITLCRAPK